MRSPLWIQGVSVERFGAIAVAGLLAFGAGQWAFRPTSDGTALPWIPLSALALASVLAVLAQLCARAVQWSNLGLGVMMTLLGNGHERPQGARSAAGPHCSRSVSTASPQPSAAPRSSPRCFATRCCC